jgi:hypothetical protein
LTAAGRTRAARSACAVEHVVGASVLGARERSHVVLGAEKVLAHDGPVDIGPCPKRAQTKWHAPSFDGPSWHEPAGRRVYQLLTGPFVRTHNAEADGPIPSSPTKDLMKGYFWSREYKHLNAEVDRPGSKR